MLEAISSCEKFPEKNELFLYTEDNLEWDHIWWISDVSNSDPLYSWYWEYGIEDILVQIHEALVSKEQFINHTNTFSVHEIERSYSCYNEEGSINRRP
jgi:hypothetical protein